MAKEKEKPKKTENSEKKEPKLNMKNYDYVGLAEQLKNEKANPLYILGSMDAFMDDAPEPLIRDAYKSQLRIDSTQGMSGLELAVSVFGKKRNEARNKTSLAEFCDIYSPSDFIKDSFKDFYKETIGDIERKVQEINYILSNPKLKEDPESLSKDEKENVEKAKKDFEKYGPIYEMIKLVEDKAYAQLRITALDRAEEIMLERYKKPEKEKAA